MTKSNSHKPAGLTLQHLWIAAPFFVIAVRALRSPLPLLDFWWHLKMGEVIVSTGSIPRTDLFSYTASGQQFIIQNWLGEIVYYLTYRLGGLPLLIVLNAALLAAALLPVFLLCRESTGRVKLASIVTLLVCLAFAVNARPQVFSLVLFSFFYWIVEGYRFQRRDFIWLLPFAIVLWVNLHGSFIVGLGLCAVVLISQAFLFFSNRVGEGIVSGAQLRKLGIVFVACLAATLLNPESYRIYDYIRTVITDPASRQLVMEWQPPRVDSWTGIQMFFALFAVATVTLMSTHRRPNLTDLALFFAFSLFGLTALRNTVWFAIVIAPIAARYWTSVEFKGTLLPLGRFLGIAPMHNELAQNASPRPSPANLILIATAVIVIVASSPWFRQAHGQGLLEPRTPVKAVDYIERHSLRGHIFHPQIFGDYIIWRLFPRQRSFIDGRVHLFGDSFVKDYTRVFYDSHWEADLARFDVQYLLLSKHVDETGNVELIRRAYGSKKWTVLFEDSVSVLFAKNF